MDLSIKEIIDELNVDVFYNPLIEEAGYYIASVNLIVINSNMDEHEQTKALLHELGHASNHQNNYYIYNRTVALHSKMEAEAEEFMTRYLIDKQLSGENIVARDFNYIRFIEDNELDENKSHIIKKWIFESIREKGLV